MNKFGSWQEVLDHARVGRIIAYHAPMDVTARSVLVVKVFKNGKIRLSPLTSDASRFTADEGHLDRFRRVG